ncbi:MAG: hypothetical protein DWI57_09540 [Chloroflexi bacterium]|nr:MAG: hypothetical protein DWI57_09540 [Chloroflexota bacterium]
MKSGTQISAETTDLRRFLSALISPFRVIRVLFSNQWLLIALLLCHLLLAAAFSLANPLGEAPDEADHWAYTVYLAQERSLPVGPTVTQSKHPPFYHASAALIAALFAEPSFDFLRANPDLRVPIPPGGPVNFFVHTAQESWPWRDGPLAFHLARLWSILLSLGTVVAVYGLTRSAFPAERGLALTVAGVLAFLPTFAFIGSAVSNDGAAAFFATTALWGAFAIYRSGGRLRAGWWTALALGLGLLTKVSVVAVWPSVALLVAAPFVARRAWHPFLTRQLALFVPAGLLAAPWFWRNWRLYGDPLGLELARQTIDQRLSPWTWADSWWLLKGWFLSFWGRYGAIGQIAQPLWLDWLLLALTLLSALGLARLLLRQRQGDVRFGVAILLLTIASVAAVMWRYSLVALGTDQGRLLYPALGPIVGLWVLGLTARPDRPDRCAEKIDLPVPFSLSAHLSGLALVGATALWSVAILAGLIFPAYSPARVLGFHPPATGVTPLDFGEIQLQAAELESSPLLYWTAAQPPTQDWRALLRISAEDGTLIWEWQRSPGQGRFATDRWPGGVVVRDLYAVQWPEWAGSGRYRVEVGVRSFAGAWALPSQAGQPAANPDHPFTQIGWIVYQK